ncbi:methyl-accepting chemotaxis protein [Vibrio cholerae]|nr:methyl-accepting chemotaxis protein [Vibrio cholerae]
MQILVDVSEKSISAVHSIHDKEASGLLKAVQSNSRNVQQLIENIEALQERSRNRGGLAANQHSIDEGEVELF